MSPQDMRRFVVAAICAVVIHVGGLLALAPLAIANETDEAAVQPEEEQAFEVQYVEELPERYVETNPDLPENEPDETNNIASRDQQAAQVNPPTSDDAMTPDLDGEDPEAAKVVSGEAQTEPTPPAQQPTPPVATQPMQQPVPETSSQAAPPPPKTRRAVEFDLPEPEAFDPVSPASVFEDFELNVDLAENEIPSDVTFDDAGENPEGRGETPDAEATKGEPDPRDTLRKTQPMKPRPRPTLSRQTLPGKTIDSGGGAPVLEAVGISARFTEFGAYLDRMFNAIGTQWLTVASRSTPVRSEVGTVVRVEFTLNSEGSVSDVKVVETTAGRVATLICTDAVMSRSPFPEWTAEMKQSLADSETITVAFYYR